MGSGVGWGWGGGGGYGGRVEVNTRSASRVKKILTNILKHLNSFDL